jgi:hypothetical protein
MKIIVLAVCCVLFASQAFGQQAPQTQPGKIKIWAGAGLLAAGLFTMPLTGLGHTDGGYVIPLASVGVTAAGGSLIYWGVRDKQKARRPNTTIGVTFRRSAAIQVRRSW